MINKAHKILLNPTKAQKVLLHKSFGCARHSYNWALEKWKELYKQGEKPSAFKLVKLQNSIKKTEMPFYLDVNKCAVQYAIHNLESAYKRMWKGISKYPKFKKKGLKDSFVAIENEVAFNQKDNRIRIPRIGWIKCYENLRYKGKVNNVVIKRIADKYFAIVNVVSEEEPAISENQTVVGIDLGIKTLITCSDGLIFDNPKALGKNLKKLKRLQRKFSKKQKGSKNKNKQLVLIAKKHYQISCIRNNAIHQATSFLTNHYGSIVIEDLKVQEMLKNKNLSRLISDVSFFEIKRQLVYKSQWKGVKLVQAERYFASSKICSNCGNKKHTLSLKDRIYNCENCNISIDRDINAAKNLANYSPTDKTSESEACGADSNIILVDDRMAMKQEIFLKIKKV